MVETREDIIRCESSWKIFGEKSRQSMEADRAEGLPKRKIRDKFDCAVGRAYEAIALMLGRLDTEEVTFSHEAEDTSRLTSVEVNLRTGLDPLRLTGSNTKYPAEPSHLATAHCHVPPY